MGTQVFISHSSKDADRAGAIGRLISACLDFDDDEITCTSAHPFGLPIGANFEDKLRRSIGKCKVFVGLVSEHSLSSLFCTMETGAAWGHEKPFKLILAPSVDASTLQRPLSSYHAVRWSDANAWRQLVTEIEDETGALRRNPQRWSELSAAIAAERWSDLR